MVGLLTASPGCPGCPGCPVSLLHIVVPRLREHPCVSHIAGVGHTSLIRGTKSIDLIHLAPNACCLLAKGLSSEGSYKGVATVDLIHYRLGVVAGWYIFRGWLTMDEVVPLTRSARFSAELSSLWVENSPWGKWWCRKQIFHLFQHFAGQLAPSFSTGSFIHWTRLFLYVWECFSLCSQPSSYSLDDREIRFASTITIQ